MNSNPPNRTDSGTSPLGMTLFAVYTLLYLGFVLINTFMADAMDTIVFAGLNLAIVYGFGLIVVAIILALIYGVAAGRSDLGKQSQGEPGGDA